MSEAPLSYKADILILEGVDVAGDLDEQLRLLEQYKEDNDEVLSQKDVCTINGMIIQLEDRITVRDTNSRTLKFIRDKISYKIALILVALIELNKCR